MGALARDDDGQKHSVFVLDLINGNRLARRRLLSRSFESVNCGVIRIRYGASYAKKTGFS